MALPCYTKTYIHEPTQYEASKLIIFLQLTSGKIYFSSWKLLNESQQNEGSTIFVFTRAV